ncbi:MAG: sulfatase-like hydrolase/transferase [Desulfobaccales bacterium]
MNVAPPQYIVLLIMDTVGAKHCSLYGYPRDTTPGLRRIAEEAMLYEHCFAPASWTLPSHASLFTGLYPSEHQCRVEDLVFQGNFYTLPEILQGMGYYTVGISSNYFISRLWRFNHGFNKYYDMDTIFNNDRYCNMRYNLKKMNKSQKTWQEVLFIIRNSFQQRYYQYPLLHLIDRIYRKMFGNCLNKSYHVTRLTFLLAKKIFKKMRNRQIFLFINVMEAHIKYNPPKKYRQRFADNRSMTSREALLYDQEIAFLDDQIYDFYTFLKKHHLDRDTMFIISSDHGEAFGEHGHSGHIFTVYNEVIHVPLLIKYPQEFGLSGRTPSLTQLHDLYATLLEVSGAPLPRPMSSISLLSPSRELVRVENIDLDIWRQNREKRSLPFEPYMQPCRALIDQDLFKLVEWQDGRLELYDLKTDFQESENLAQKPEMGARVEILKKMMENV